MEILYELYAFMLNCLLCVYAQVFTFYLFHDLREDLSLR